MQVPLPIEALFRDDVDINEPFDLIPRTGGVLIVQHAFGLTIPETLAEVRDPQRTALIIYDMQAGIVPQLPMARRPSVASSKCGSWLANAGAVFYTRHMSLPNEVSGVSQLRTSMAWQRLTRVEDVKPRSRAASPEDLPTRHCR